MDSSKKPEVIPSASLGGQIWFLKVTHTTLERFSSIAKCNLMDFDDVLQRYDMMVLLLWLMMAEKRPDLTRDKVRAWLDELPVFDAMQLVAQAVGDAVAYSFPTPSEDAEPAGDEAADPTEKDT